jgi:ribose 5-phosphate isomerase B
VTDTNKIIAIASDHAGFELKNRVAEFLKSGGYQVLDLGTHSAESVDYPDYGFAMAEAIAEDKAQYGIAICGSGVGIDIAVNRNPKARSALCHDVTSARLARAHNDANVLSLGARLIGIETALECVKTFLNTPFEGGRHAKRVKKLGLC